MKEQTINIDSINPTLGYMNRLFLLIMISACMFLSACMPSGEQDVNTELFKNKEEMTAKSEQLKTGMRKADVFKDLGINQSRFQKMSIAEVQMSIYGNSQVTGSPEQLEQFRKRLTSYEGYSLPYREIKSSSSLGFGKMKMEKTGHDLRLVLVFERDRLVKSSIEGTMEVKQNEDRYLWDSLISRGIGAAF
jgi:hypothetical protein